MIESIQEMMLTIFGLILILILLNVLRIVHIQAQKMKDLEFQMKANELTEKNMEDEANG